MPETPKKRLTQTRRSVTNDAKVDTEQASLLEELSTLLEQARRTVSRSVNSVMTATYWEIGRRIVTEEQRGRRRADYGEALVQTLSEGLTAKFGRGFSVTNLILMRQFYTIFSLNTPSPIHQTLSDEFANGDTSRAPSAPGASLPHFPLSWSHYVRLLQVKSEHARRFYAEEALRGGWTVRQLDRQIDSQFYERTALSRNKRAMLTKGQQKKPEDHITPEEELKDPFVLEFLSLKDEYSETELEAALIHHLETFLLELGSDFTFVGRQRRLRVGDAWYRVDLVFFHRALRCLILIDLKLGKFTHADAGQMHLYLNYAKTHWTRADENQPVGLILCAAKNETVAHYALEGLPNKVLAAEYRTTLPDERVLETTVLDTRRSLEQRESIRSQTKKKLSKKSPSARKR